MGEYIETKEFFNKRFIGIPRISSKKQEKGDSIEAQTSRFKQFCELNNHKLVDIYLDENKKHESATIDEDKRKIKLEGDNFIVDFNLKSRKPLIRAVKEAIEGTDKWDGILIFKWDRFSRDPPFLKLLQIYLESLGKILIPTDDPTDPLSAGIVQLVGKYEIDKMKARVRQTRLYRFEQGIMVGRSPLGYKPLLKDKKIIGFKIYEKEAVIIRNVFQGVIDGLDYREICKNNNLKPQQYYNIIKNPVYAGFIQFEGKTKKGLHEPIVSEEIFNRVQEIIKK